MTHPDLYRVGSASSPGYDKVRVGKDIQTDSDGNVHPKTGGVSTFTEKDKSWKDNRTWVLQKNTALVPGLSARNDHGKHFVIEPDSVMKLDAYVDHLKKLNNSAVRYDHVPKSTEDKVKAEERTLKTQSAHTDRATRFVYDALSSIVRAQVSVEGWDENDYAYVAELAHALEDGELSLSALVWDTASAEGRWSKARVFTADAVSAYIAEEAARVKASGNEEEEADAANDHAFLRTVLKFDDAKNPFIS